ncbi:CoB--CoM heterodisulfide reductase subunit B [Methanosarcina mazei]|uniref:Ferredoxin:CoB-CoM heterodisulfide reductase subunit B n=3 Tax=Methanosarcina mazei TaxID=2209 RepID=HDRB_METMA|nr:CoB--CoM heterodisulfide reductase subunit B [Methanosarcina mazei]Q8PY83.2 RecName: Full=Ferredoxin:CoB-CoM heterodisulfide reductase subunit B [Methanosarcina mazei Go1]AKB63515.1 CoB--CoM heterodisulfide reductase subunit B [Methanosarcina mazei S-6]AKB66864.1 CoB--CoM heterodisulfide reductase subunit B [Methanosarcina mazei LYC]TAH75009.1 MAG: CoB--CoM heterodisulfide reductase subunit B [Methanosarcina mazei]WIM47674.1 CoB--CoM heterodisulfide reductase subunit B [Methanosarcina mazei
MNKLSLFLGCIVPNRYPGIEKATKLCLQRLEIDACDLPGASCCPAPGVFKSFDKATWLALASRNIVLSERMERDVLTVCNGCYGSLADANMELKKDPEMKACTNSCLKEIGMEFRGTSEIRHIIEFLYKEFGPEKLKEYITTPLDLKVALHYGCHLIKPSKDRNLGDTESPVFFDELVEATGAKSVDYTDKMMCCGAGGGVRSGYADESLEMLEHKLDCICKAGVDCIVNACPFCHLQFDRGQIAVNEKFGTDYSIPVLHYSQLLGLALGFSPDQLGIEQNAVQNIEFLAKIYEISAGLS